MASAAQLGTITTDIPARLDRLPWARFHWLVVVGLGTVWILDGLEVTIVGSMSEALKPADTGLGLSNFDIGLAGAMYVAGGCVSALIFGQLTDLFGRFYAIGTAAGGIAGPLLFGSLIQNASDSGEITKIALGYFIGAALMIIGGVVEVAFGVKAERQPLEDLAKPLTAEDAADEETPAASPKA